MTERQAQVELPFDRGCVRFQRGGKAGRHLTGTIELDAANPFGQRQCEIDLQIPGSWPEGTDLAVVRIIAHWYRDIGNLPAKITHRHACHVAARLGEGYKEEDIHQAINAYAASGWHRSNRKWAAIGSWFGTTTLDRWCTKAVADRHDAEEDARRAAQAREAAQHRRQTKAQREAQVQSEAQTAAQAARRRAEEAQAKRQAEADARAAARIADLEASRAAFEQLPEAVQKAAFDRASNLYRKQFPGRATVLPFASTSDPRFQALLYTCADALAPAAPSATIPAGDTP